MGNKFTRRKKKKGKEAESITQSQSEPTIPTQAKHRDFKQQLSDRLDSSPQLLNSVQSKYKLGKKLGRGHFATVQLGVVKATNEKVAVKCIRLTEFKFGTITTKKRKSNAKR